MRNGQRDRRSFVALGAGGYRRRFGLETHLGKGEERFGTAFESMRAILQFIRDQTPAGNSIVATCASGKQADFALI